MSRPGAKDRAPIVILCAVCAALFALGGYVVFLRLQANTPAAVVETAPRTGRPTPEPIAESSATPKPTELPAWITEEPQADPAEASPFWSDGILYDGDTYRSPTLFVSVSKVRDADSFRYKAVYYVAEIRVKDVTQIMTASTAGNFARRSYGDVAKAAKKNASLIAISGDYYSAHNSAFVVRNGTAFREKTGYGDVCVLWKNGEMETFRKGAVDVDSILKGDPWQVWEFGPALLDDDGNARTSFTDSHIGGANPRCCIGYVEPGHYYFVVADGRSKNTPGMTLKDLAKLMESLGCKVAYNLDGGASAHFYWHDRIYNHPSGGGRDISDIIYIAKEPYSESRFFSGKAGMNE
jgi:exopolysaccharide biosynthesis protein